MATGAAGRAPRCSWHDAAAATAASSDVEVDLRVDDHQRPVAELRRLLDLHRLYFGRPDPATLLPLEGELADEVARDG